MENERLWQDSLNICVRKTRIQVDEVRCLVIVVISYAELLLLYNFSFVLFSGFYYLNVFEGILLRFFDLFLFLESEYSKVYTVGIISTYSLHFLL